MPSLSPEIKFLVQLFVISHQQEFPSQISLRLPAKDHRASAHAFSYLLPPHRPTLIFAYELPDSPRHPRWLQVIHLPTQKLVHLLRRFEKYRGKKVISEESKCDFSNVAISFSKLLKCFIYNKNSVDLLIKKKNKIFGKFLYIL